MDIVNASKYDFIQRTELLFAMPMPVSLRLMLDYCEFQIYSDFGTTGKQAQSKQKCRSSLANVYKQAVKSMSKEERLSYYWFVTDCVFKLTYGKRQQSSTREVRQFKKSAFICFYGSIKFEKWTIESTSTSSTLNIISALKPPIYLDLSLYLCRKSKNDNYLALVLDASDPRVRKSYRKIVIGFKDRNEFSEVFGMISQAIKYQIIANIRAAYQGDPLTRGILTQARILDERLLCEQTQVFYSCRKIEDQEIMDISQNRCDQIGSIEYLDQESQQLELSQEACRLKQDQICCKWKVRQKLKLMKDINSNYWSQLAIQEGFKLSKSNADQLLLEVHSNKSMSEIYQQIQQMPSYNIQSIKQKGERKQNLSSYEMQLKSNDCGTIVEPFAYERLVVHHEDQNQVITHEYGNQIVNYYQTIWHIFRTSDKKVTIMLLLDMKSRSLTRGNNLKLGIKYLKGVFERINYSIAFFTQTDVRTDSIHDKIKIKELDSRYRYLMRPLPANIHKSIAGPCLEKVISNDWMKDTDSGGLEYLNKDKIAAQKTVIKHILKQMSRNILAGKSILNMSLPVHIFSTESHLERLLYSFRLAPLLFDKVAAIDKQNIARDEMLHLLNLACIFGISTSLLYLSQEKSFNPILGETCQMWIDGCPIYGEQISHHPPISAIYFVGRGFRIYGQLEAKVELGLNTGKGSNDGKVTIQFDNGITIQNYFAAGEVSGLSFGKRKFHMVNKSCHFVKSAGILLEVDYSTKQTKCSKLDSYYGQFYQIDPNDITNFKASRKIKNRKAMRAIESKIKVEGVWNQFMRMKQTQSLNMCDMHLNPMSREKQPLPSDSIWREDIYYRKQSDMVKAQFHKQQLQECQRRDRKLRQTCKI